MIQFNKIQWAKCPCCKIQLNDWGLYNLSLLQSGGSFYRKMNCPQCKKDFLIKLEISAIFKTEGIKDVSKSNA